MALNLLSESLQDVVLYNFDAYGKIILMLFLVGLSAYYLFYHRKHVEEDTIYFNVYIARIFFFVYSSAILVFVVPFGLFFISPEYTLKQFYSIFLILWNSTFTIWFLTFILDVFRYGFIGIPALGGLKVDKNTDKFAKKLKLANFFKYKI